MPRYLDPSSLAVLLHRCPQVLAHPLVAPLIAGPPGTAIVVVDGEDGPLPSDMVAALCEYLATAHPLGGFLSSLVANDLHRAATNADDGNARRLCDFGIWIRQSWPQGAYGSYDKLDAWEGLADA